MQQTVETVCLIIAEVAFRDWTFEVADVGTEILVRVAFQTGDIKTGEMLKHTGRKWHVSKHATKSEIVQTCIKAVLTALEHEAREDFKYRGRPIFGPHFDVDDLATRTPQEDLRKEFPF